jgi:hypothetical protein
MVVCVQPAVKAANPAECPMGHYQLGQLGRERGKNDMWRWGKL